MHPSRTSGAPVTYSSNSDVSGKYRAWILGSWPRIWMYVARHQKEHELCTVWSNVWGFVVEVRISSAAANCPKAENSVRHTADCQDKGDHDLQTSFVA